MSSGEGISYYVEKFQDKFPGELSQPEPTEWEWEVYDRAVVIGFYNHHGDRQTALDHLRLQFPGADVNDINGWYFGLVNELVGADQKRESGILDQFCSEEIQFKLSCGAHVERNSSLYRNSPLPSDYQN